MIGFAVPDADPRYADPRYADPRYTDPRYTDPRYADPRYAEAVAPEEDPSRYHYDGWAARVALGQGFIAAQIAPPDGEGHDVKGTAACVDAAVARTIGGAPGFALGVGVAGCLAPGRRTTLETRPHDGVMYLVTLGMIADGYPDPHAGFHLGGEWNFALVSTGEPGSSRALGPGAALWLGYDAFVAPEWSLGAQLRGTVAAAFEGVEDPNAPADTPATVVRTESIAVLFSVLNQ